MAIRTGCTCSNKGLINCSPKQQSQDTNKQHHVNSKTDCYLEFVHERWTLETFNMVIFIMWWPNKCILPILSILSTKCIYFHLTFFIVKNGNHSWLNFVQITWKYWWNCFLNSDWPALQKYFYQYYLRRRIFKIGCY